MNYRYFTHLSIVGCLITAIGFLASCDSKTAQNTEQPPATNDSVATAPSPVVSSNQSELLKTVVGSTGDGFFRGLNFGDPVSKIKATEKFELFEDSTDHVGYTYETENFEAIDVMYYLDKNQTIKRFRVDSYLNSSAAVRSLWDQFDTYLSGRFKNDKKGNKVAIWRGPDNIYIQLEDVSKGKDFGIRLSMGPKASMVNATTLSN